MNESVADNSAVLVCRDVVRRFEEGDSVLEVLSGVDLEILPGERVAIIGASGSGKTTLLQIMGGLDEPTAGDVHVGGQPMAHISEADKGLLRNKYLGFVYQFHHLLPEFSAAENVAMPLMIRGQSRSAALAEAGDTDRLCGRQRDRPADPRAEARGFGYRRPAAAGEKRPTIPDRSAGAGGDRDAVGARHRRRPGHFRA